MNGSPAVAEILVPLLVSLGAVVSAVGSAWLVYKANTNTTRVTAEQQTFAQHQDMMDGLRQDILELDNQRREYYRDHVQLLRVVESYRAWAYQLVRVLHDNGIIEDLPVEPEDQTTGK